MALMLGISCLGIQSSSAVGFRLPNQDPEGIARGNAFAATADNPSAIYYNPAGITQIEGQAASVGLYMISANTHFTSTSGEEAKTDTSVQFVPQVHYVNSLKSVPLSIGIGVYAPYGLGLDWGKDNPFRTAAQKGKLLYACANPVIAWQVHSTLSIAAGPTINYAQASFKQGATALNPDDAFKFDGDAFAVGFNAGLRWQPHEMISLGVNYRSATTMDFEGDSELYPYFPSRSTSASFEFPQYIVGGISFRPTPDWNIEFDLDWTDWDQVDTITFKGTSLGDIPFVLNYQSGFMYEFGVTRQLGKGYFASIGYIYSENSSPDRNYSPLIPDANLHLGSVGFGYHGKRWNFAIGYHFAYNPGRDVEGNINPQIDGEYRTFNNAINISTALKF